jgi:DoxX-like family
MFIAYIILNSLLAAGMAWCAFAEFSRFDGIPAQMAKAEVPLIWLPTLAAVKVVALVGLVIGFWVPIVGTAAALGIAVYFVAAILIHVTARDSNVWGATFFLLLGCAALAVRIAATTAFGLGVLSS